MIEITAVTKQSPQLGSECTLCKELFAPGDEIVLCPTDGAPHHTHCWRANGNKCSALGCAGRGPIAAPPRLPQSVRIFGRQIPLPFNTVTVAQSCLILSIAIAIILIAFSCFGLWAIADYIAINIFGWDYRAPLSSLLPTILFIVGR
ncbi:MAG: hypothetical protein KC419_04260 [Anaerolineales bacterium]|nr:hypothetical protein [Anaerolineales bacterium]MCA9927660.1 hypothetical protein [Anaerolineales bacterium]